MPEYPDLPLGILTFCIWMAGAAVEKRRCYAMDTPEWNAYQNEVNYWEWRAAEAKKLMGVPS